jgi:hypothetical protein
VARRRVEEKMKERYQENFRFVLEEELRTSLTGGRFKRNGWPIERHKIAAIEFLRKLDQIMRGNYPTGRILLFGYGQKFPLEMGESFGLALDFSEVSMIGIFLSIFLSFSFLFFSFFLFFVVVACKNNGVM